MIENELLNSKYHKKLSGAAGSILGSSWRDCLLLKFPEREDSDIDLCVNEKGYRRILFALKDPKLYQDGIRIFGIKISKISIHVTLCHYEGDTLHMMVWDIRKYIGNWPHQILFEFDEAIKLSEDINGFMILNKTARYIYYFQHARFHKNYSADRTAEVVSWFDDSSIFSDNVQEVLSSISSSPVEIFAERLRYRKFEPFSFKEKYRIFIWYTAKLGKVVRRITSEYSPSKKIGYSLMAVLCGCDGAGKSTILERLIENINRKGARIEGLHFNRDAGVINYLENATNRDKTDAVYLDKSGYRKKANSLQVIFRIMSSLDKWIGINLRLSSSRKKHILIIDRYIPDYFLRDTIVGLKYPKALRALLLIIFPKPDLFFYIHSSADEIFSRKKEYADKIQIEREIKLYRRYLNKIGIYNFLMVYNDRLKSSVAEILREIIDHLHNTTYSKLK